MYLNWIFNKLKETWKLTNHMTFDTKLYTKTNMLNLFLNDYSCSIVWLIGQLSNGLLMIAIMCKCSIVNYAITRIRLQMSDFYCSGFFSIYDCGCHIVESHCFSIASVSIVIIDFQFMIMFFHCSRIGSLWLFIMYVQLLEYIYDY